MRAQRVFILDEPTRGVNAGANREIYRLINALVDAGSGVLRQSRRGLASGVRSLTMQLPSS